MRPVFETAGDIRSVDLLASLVSLWHVKAGGVLRFSRSGASAGFEVLEGEVVASRSSQSQFDVSAILARGGSSIPPPSSASSGPRGLIPPSRRCRPA
jgi:hypothetical protein